MQLSNENLSNSFLRVDPVILDLPLDASSKLILSFILSWHVQGKSYYGGNESLARLVRVSRSTLKRRLAELKMKQYITITINTDKQSQTNTIDIGERTIKLFLDRESVKSIETSEPVPVKVSPKAEDIAPVMTSIEAPAIPSSTERMTATQVSSNSNTSRSTPQRDEPISTVQLESESDQLPVEVIRAMSYWPSKGRDNFSERDAVLVFALYGRSRSEAIEWRDRLQAMGWPVNNKLDECKRAACGLKDQAKRQEQALKPVVSTKFDYDDMIDPAWR